MTSRIKLALAVVALALSSQMAVAQTGVERLYVLNCGEGTAGDISRWTPGLNEGKTMDFVDSCYLIKHAKGWFLWDTGIADSVAAMPNGLAPADPKAVTWRRPRLLPPSWSSSASSLTTSRRWRSRTPSGPYRQCRAVPAGDALRPEGRI